MPPLLEARSLISLVLKLDIVYSTQDPFTSPLAIDLYDIQSPLAAYDCSISSHTYTSPSPSVVCAVLQFGYQSVHLCTIFHQCSQGPPRDTH